LNKAGEKAFQLSLQGKQNGDLSDITECHLRGSRCRHLLKPLTNRTELIREIPAGVVLN